MGYAELAYPSRQDTADVLTVAVFADSDLVRAQLREDLALRWVEFGGGGPLAALSTAPVRALADIVLVDAPAADGTTLAALARLDHRAARSGAQLVVATSLEALDAVFGCVDQSGAQVLVNPTKGERVIALARAVTMLTGMRVCELSEADRLTLLRLTEQVAEIASRLDRVADGALWAENAFRLESPSRQFRGEGSKPERELLRQPRPPLPDPRLVRRIIRQRRMREQYFDAALFADPAWDILLDLTAARAEHQRVSVTSLCIASGVPPTTALRWIGQMVEAGLLERVEDDTDRRRAFIGLSDRTADAMARYFAELGETAERAV